MLSYHMARPVFSNKWLPEPLCQPLPDQARAVVGSDETHAPADMGLV
jgi:hypothetical protein